MELNLKSTEESYLENLQIFENSVTHVKISHESKKKSKEKLSLLK